ncbi:MAG: glycosyltransferase family 2 protein [Oscillospiraceae bacterium]|nr:glycosyltransferase family 2 protein [Oscillospiraceae bacterium]
MKTKLTEKIGSAAKYMAFKLGLRQYARKSRRIIKEHFGFVRPFRKALAQSLFISHIENSYNLMQDYMRSYSEKNVQIVKQGAMPKEKSEPILVCVVKNDLRRVKEHLSHHRKIGVRHFAYIDNGSADGTDKWLKEQKDVSLFTVSEAYNGFRQRGWERQVLDIFGYDRWYLIVDSDEFFAYPGVESIPITQYISYLQSKKIEAVFAPMIDMYANGPVFNQGSDRGGLGFRDEYCYFDTDTYKIHTLRHTQRTIGGPRLRTYGLKNYLAKYPLIKVQKPYMPMTHDIYPFKLSRQTSGAAAFLLHYKFLSEDYDRFINWSNVPGSEIKAENDIYLQAYRDNPDLSFYYDGSCELTNSKDLLKINICDRAFFDGLSSFRLEK